jgi:hypothetical protein
VPSLKLQTAVAFAVNTPGVLLLIVSVHVAVLPSALNVGVAHVLLFARSGVGETLGVIDTRVGVDPDGIAVVEMVNVCASPTSFTSFWPMVTFASTNRFTAGPELPWVESVVLVTDAVFVPSVKLQTAVAFAVNTPALLLLIVTVQVRVLPVPVGVQVVCEPGDGETLTVRDVSDGVVPAGIAVVETLNV